jgi:hypothetical protein
MKCTTEEALDFALRSNDEQTVLHKYSASHVIMQLGDFSVVDMQTVRDPKDKDIVTVSIKSLEKNLNDVPDDAKGGRNVIKIDGEWVFDSRQGGEGEMAITMNVRTEVDKNRTHALGEKEEEKKIEEVADEVKEEEEEEEEEKEVNGKPTKKKKVVRTGKMWGGSSNREKSGSIALEAQENTDAETLAVVAEGGEDGNPGEEEAKEIIDHILDFGASIANWFGVKRADTAEIK